MMGTRKAQKELFNCQVDLDKRVREENPLRAIDREVDFTFVRGEVAERYGTNVPPGSGCISGTIVFLAKPASMPRAVRSVRLVRGG